MVFLYGYKFKHSMVNYQDKTTIFDVTAGSALMGKGETQAFALLDDMDSNNCQW